MSYDIVRSVKIDKNGTVTLKSASNNVWPRTPSEWQMTYRNEHNPFTGKLGGEVEVFAGYEQGSFQGGSNKFTRQLEVLRYMPEYAAFDWRNNWETAKENNKSKREYYELLARALKTPAPKPRYAIVKNSPYTLGQKVYFRQRKGAGVARWYYEAEKATLFRYAEDAEHTKQCFNNSENWEVINTLKVKELVTA